MSYWTRVDGIVNVNVGLGRTQEEVEYILKTVLAHLPLITGSERDAQIEIIKQAGHSYHCSHDEFGMRTNKGWLEYQDNYLIVLHGDLRDRRFNDTLKEVSKWLCRLAKRIFIDDVLIRVSEGENKQYIFSNADAYRTMYEHISYYNKRYFKDYYKDIENINWASYLLWERSNGWDMPMLLAAKYYNVKDNDKELIRRKKYHSKER